MPTIILTLFAVSLIACVISVYLAVKANRQYKTNALVAEELSEILAASYKAIHKARNKISESKTTKTLNKQMNMESIEKDFFQSPELLSTLVTVLIHKYGDTWLSLKDFTIDDEEYVSVYVDSESQHIILSLDKNLELTTQYKGFVKSDDNTYH